jgi:uncharacterized protein (DUF1015 family)
VVEHGGLRSSRRARVVVCGDGVEELRAHLGREACRPFLDQTQPEMDVAEEAPLVGGPERGAAAELDRATDVVEERGGDEQIASEPLVQLRRLAAERRHADGVLEQPAGVGMVVERGRQAPHRLAHARVAEHAVDGRPQSGMRQLAGEEVEESVELVGIPAPRRRKRPGIGLGGGLERADLELEPVAEALDAPEHTHGVPLVEAAVQELDVLPDAGVDPAARIDELEHEIGGAAARSPALLARDRVDALDHAVLGELGDRHILSLGPPTDVLYGVAVAVVKPFRAVRYGERAGPLGELVAPPYDVIGPEERREYLARSPYNVVHLTLPDSEQDAARAWAEWLADGVLRPEAEPGFWALSQDYVGPDGIGRRRTGLVASLRLEPYESRVVLPHERTHAGPKEGRLRLLRATGVELEPIFLLYDGEQPFAVPGGEPDVEVEGTRLWRLEPGGIAEAFVDRQLLIADGHHRYETALAYHAESGTDENGWMLAVLVSTRDEGLTIFPTHRLFQNERLLSPNGAGRDPERALEELERLPYERAAAVQVTVAGAEVVTGEPGQLDVQLVDRLGHEGIAYTPDWRDAVRRVQEGEAGTAYLLRPTRIEDVFAAARRGDVMPQKTTYFYPKLVSGLLFHPL